jgi:outer membrane lipoprotein-sorting protein
MNNLVRFLLLIILPVWSFAQSQPMTAKEAAIFKVKVAEATKKVTTIQSDFTQEKEMSVLAEKIVTKGKFYYKKEKMLRWEYTDPFPYLIIINKEQLLVRDEDKENRINIQSNKFFRELNTIIIGAVSGTLLNDEKNFKPSFADDKTSYVTVLIPQSAKIRESLSEIVLYFNKTDYTVEKLVMREASGDYTRILFTNRKLNQPIPDERFAIP